MRTGKPASILTLSLVAACALNACYHSKVPGRVAKDTAAAQTSADQTTAKVEQHADEKVSSAQAVVHDEQAAEAHTRAIGTEKVADSQAEGIQKIALAQCESMSGEAQKACRNRANTAYDTAEAQARQQRADSDPIP